MFEYFELIVFQLAERIALKELIGEDIGLRDVVFQAFSYNALRSRHEVSRKPYLRKEKSVRLCGFENKIHETPKKSKLSHIVDMAKTILNNQLSVGGIQMVSAPPALKGNEMGMIKDSLLESYRILTPVFAGSNPVSPAWVLYFHMIDPPFIPVAECC